MTAAPEPRRGEGMGGMFADLHRDRVTPTTPTAARIEADGLTEFRAACDAVGIPHDVEGLIRHHRGNAGLAASFASATRIARLEADLAAAESLHRDLVSRLGFGNNITEPMADNDTVVKWFEEQGRDASEWQESQLWRNDCYALGHPDDEDCYECDPRLRLERALADLAAARSALGAVEALADAWDYDTPDRKWHHAASFQLRAALATPGEG